MDLGYVITQGCSCPACDEIRSYCAVRDGLLWRKMSYDMQAKLFEEHCQYMDRDYGMSELSIIKRDIKELLTLLKQIAIKSKTERH